MSGADNSFDYKEGVTLKEFLTNKIKALEDKMEMTFKLNQTAIDKAEVLMNDRLAGMNEFREALKDQANTFITRIECKNGSSRRDEDIRNLQLSKAILEGKASQVSVNVALAISLIGLLVGLFGLLLRFIR